MRADQEATIDLMRSEEDLKQIIRDLLALPEAQKQLPMLDKGVGTATPNAAWLRARAAVS